MKKAAAILLTFTMLFLVGCDNGRPETTPEPSPVAVSSGDCYEVSMLKNNDGIEKYSYTVKTHDGKVIESAICANKPKVKPLNGDLLGIRFYTDSDSFVRYYDIKSGRVSASYFDASWHCAQTELPGARSFCVCGSWQSLQVTPAPCILLCSHEPQTNTSSCCCPST